jgi:hypothetical protein
MKLKSIYNFVVVALTRLFRRSVCAHEFHLSDLQKTGIPPLETPIDRHDYRGWMTYYCNIYTHPSVTERVEWPCVKCGKVFRAHCGLDVLSHGKISSMNGEL